MSDSENGLFEKLCDHERESAMLASIDAMLGWDERTKMPPAAGAYRAEQIQYLAGMIHRRHTDPQVGEWLNELDGSPLAKDAHSDTGATIRELRRQYDKRVKLPQSLVEELARLSVLGQQSWVEARKNNDFASFQPLLEQIVKLTKQKAEATGYADCPYDSLLDDYEPGAKTSQVREVLAALREELVPLVSEIVDSSRKPKTEILTRQYPVDVQERFGTQAATKIGFDFNRGRLDVTAHPFCTNIGPHDVRLTTRYDERHFPGAFFGTLHESGHGIYEQGLRTDQFGLPPGSAASLGIHESQSRMWENMVGRSHAFWQHFFEPAKKAFPAALSDVSLDEFVFTVNDVRASLIRVEADEATYNLHIIIRFELEQALINDELPVSELPNAWNEKYREYLGIEPPDYADGVLQDVHWSAGLIGYFPTYALGNLYAGQFFQQAREDLPDIDQQFAAGDFEPLLSWLREKIHQPGHCYSARELVEKVTGKPLSHDGLISYLREKLGPLYGLS